MGACVPCDSPPPLKIMRYLSLFSGIEAATVAWHPLGWQCAAVAEIEPFPCALLAHHYPDVPNLGDVTQITEDQIAALGHLDVIVFGSPCQDLSVAGKRAGLEGARSGLFHDAIRIVGYARQHNGLRYALWENVPGAFSSNKGADFGVVVSELAGLPSIDVPPPGLGDGGHRPRRKSFGRVGRARRAVVRSGATPPSRVRLRRFWKLAR